MTDNEVMQDSGVEWIGAIPQGWRIDRLKDIANINENSLDAKTPDDYLLKYIEISNVNSRGIVSEQAIEEIEFSAAPSRAKRQIFSGDTLISSVRPNLQAIAYVESDELNWVCSTGFYVVNSKFKHLLDNKFIYYFLLSVNSKQYFESVAKGVGYPAIDDKDFKSFYSTLPPLAEQQAIAEYLDQQCGKLDAIIAIKQQQIKSLDALRQSVIYQAVTKGLDASVPLVDSGVEWLGEIPQGWKVNIIKRKFDVKLGKMLQPLQKTELDTEEYYLKTSNVYWEGVDVININKMWFSPLDKINTELQYNDLLVCEGGDVGRSALWKEEITPCYIQNAINRVRPIHNCSTKYLYYWLFLLKHSGYIDAMVSRITIAHLTAEKLERLIFLLPTIEEQLRIADQLDQETQRLNDLKANLSQQISTLEAYKKSLIYESVTGKKRIQTDA